MKHLGSIRKTFSNADGSTDFIEFSIMLAIWEINHEKKQVISFSDGGTQLYAMRIPTECNEITGLCLAIKDFLEASELPVNLWYWTQYDTDEVTSDTIE